METSNQNQLITTLHQGLQQTRSQQARLLTRLQEIDREAETLRQEYEDLEKFANQTEEAIINLVGKSRAGKEKAMTNFPSSPMEDATPDAHISSRPYIPQKQAANGYEGSVSYINNSINRGGERPRNVNTQQVRFQENEPSSQRFADRTITQACTLLLREAGRPMHVNELYQFLMDGGFMFNGNNPTISIAVSLNRNRRFNKVAPGTFDLVMRDASQAVS